MPEEPADTDPTKVLESIGGVIDDFDAIPLGEAFTVNTYPRGFQVAPKVVMDDQGGFLVVWEAEGGLRARRFELELEADASSIRGLFLDLAGLPKGSELELAVGGAVGRGGHEYEMSRGKLGITAVTAGGRLVGCISDGDLRRLLEEQPQLPDRPAGQCTKGRPRTIDGSELASSALKRMEEHRITSLFICDDEDRLEGIVHLRDCGASSSSHDRRPPGHRPRRRNLGPRSVG